MSLACSVVRRFYRRRPIPVVAATGWLDTHYQILSSPVFRSAMMSSICSRPAATRNQVIADAGAGSLIGTDAGVGGGGRVGDGGLGVSEVGGDRQQPGRVDYLPCLPPPTADFKRDHAAETAMQASRQLVLGMAVKPRIINPLDRRMLLQPAGQFAVRCRSAASS